MFSNNQHYSKERNLSEIKVHWSFWVICVVALIWNIMGSINFVMQMNPDMVEKFPEEAQSLITSRPLWATIAFAVAVFGGVIAEVLLLLKKASAYYLFVASLLGIIITNIHTFQVNSTFDIWVGILMSFVIASFLIWYTRNIQRKGWVN
jgi:hypothetical protein